MTGGNLGISGVGGTMSGATGAVHGEYFVAKNFRVSSEWAWSRGPGVCGPGSAGSGGDLPHFEGSRGFFSGAQWEWIGKEVRGADHLVPLMEAFEASASSALAEKHKLQATKALSLLHRPCRCIPAGLRTAEGCGGTVAAPTRLPPMLSLKGTQRGPPLPKSDPSRSLSQQRWHLTSITPYVLPNIQFPDPGLSPKYLLSDYSEIQTRSHH